MAIFWQNTSSCFQTCYECRRPVSGSSEGNLPVHDTDWLSPIATQAVARRSPCGWHPIASPAGLVCNKMPFPTRPLQPSSLGRGPPPAGEDPLQWMTNQSLCQAMRQLVSLLKQADSVFGDLEVRGEGCVLTVLGWVLFCHGSSQCDPWAAQTPGFNDCRT